MIASSSHVLFFYLSKVYPNGYIAVGYLLFLQEQIKDHHLKLEPHRMQPRLAGAALLPRHHLTGGTSKAAALPEARYPKRRGPIGSTPTPHFPASIQVR
jgi:hypothetical protein